MRYEDHVKSKTIRNLLRDVMPESVPIGSALIANVRQRAKDILANIEKNKFRVDTFIATQDAVDIVDKSVNDAREDKLCGVNLNDPAFIGIHSKKLNAMLMEALENGEEIDHVLRFFNDARSTDVGFDFRVARNKQNKPWGICWQTGTMRAHCQEGLLDVIMFDMMKRQINSPWPYCGPIMLTGKNKIVCACEAIVFSETTNAYRWIMECIYDMSGVNRSATKLVFGYGIHSAKLLKELRIDWTANLILDQKHLKDDWMIKFPHSWPLFATSLTAQFKLTRKPSTTLHWMRYE